jgi:hypothetical protein
LTEEDFILEGGNFDQEKRFLGSKHHIKGTSKVFFDPHTALYSFAFNRSLNALKETFPQQDSWLIGIQKEDFSSITGGQLAV